MVQCRSRARFLQDAFSPGGLASYLLRQELQCNGALQLLIAGAIRYAHPAPAEFLLNAVVRKNLTNHSLDPYLDRAILGRAPRRVNAR